MNILITILLAILAINVIAIVLLFILKKIKEGRMENFEKEFKLNKKYNSKNKFKPRNYFVIIIYVIVFLIAAYLVIGSFNPDAIPGSGGTYTISADDSFLTNSISSFTINPSSVLGDKTQINGETVRPITSQQTFNLVFKPKTIIPDNANGNLEINLMSDLNKGGSEVYLNDNLIIPNTDQYQKVASFPGVNADVYIKDTLIQSKGGAGSLTDGRNPSDFIYKNFPGSSVYSQTNLESTIPQLSDYLQQTTKIPTTFRGDLKLAVYAETYLEIDFTKQDLNSYIGNDEYIVNVIDTNGKSYYTKTYEDDGDNKNTNKLGSEHDFTIKLGNLPRGIYFITFTKDKNNDSPDVTLKNIKLNSNKILIVGNSLPITSFNFYTKVSSPKIIGFNYWQAPKNQTISISGVQNNNIKLDSQWLSKIYNYNATTIGDYNIKTSVGYLWVYADYLSISKDTWFDIPTIGNTTGTNSQKFTGQDVIILDTSKIKVNGDYYTYKTSATSSQINSLKIKVLNPNKIYLKSIILNM